MDETGSLPVVTAVIHCDALFCSIAFVWENTDPRISLEVRGFFVLPFLALHPGFFCSTQRQHPPLPHNKTREPIAMEWKSLIAGLVFTMGIYAAKCGIGLACGWGEQKKKRRLVGFTVGAVLAYALVFAGSYLVLTRVDLVNQLLVIQGLARWAMAVHGAMASLLFVWGLFLLKRPIRARGAVRGWWLFALPCPVCMGVILLTLAFGIGFFPEKSLEMTSLAGGVFAMVATASFLIARSLGDRFVTLHHFLGTMMVLTALWFLLTVLVVPHVSELPDVFAMASHAAGSLQEQAGAQPRVVFLLCGLFGVGVCWDRFFLC